MKKLLFLLIIPFLLSCSDSDDDTAYSWHVTEKLSIINLNGNYERHSHIEESIKTLTDSEAKIFISRNIPKENDWTLLTDEMQKKGNLKTRKITYKSKSSNGQDEIELSIIYYAELMKIE